MHPQLHSSSLFRARQAAHRSAARRRRIFTCSASRSAPLPPAAPLGNAALPLPLAPLAPLLLSLPPASLAPALLAVPLAPAGAPSTELYTGNLGCADSGRLSSRHRSSSSSASCLPLASLSKYSTENLGKDTGK